MRLVWHASASVRNANQDLAFHVIGDYDLDRRWLSFNATTSLHCRSHRILQELKANGVKDRRYKGYGRILIRFDCGEVIVSGKD